MNKKDYEKQYEKQLKEFERWEKRYLEGYEGYDKLTCSFCGSIVKQPLWFTGEYYICDSCYIYIREGIIEGDF